MKINKYKTLWDTTSIYKDKLFMQVFKITEKSDTKLNKPKELFN